MSNVLPLKRGDMVITYKPELAKVLQVDEKRFLAIVKVEGTSEVKECDILELAKCRWKREKKIEH